MCPSRNIFRLGAADWARLDQRRDKDEELAPREKPPVHSHCLPPPNSWEKSLPPGYLPAGPNGGGKICRGQ